MMGPPYRAGAELLAGLVGSGGVASVEFEGEDDSGSRSSAACEVDCTS